MLESSSRLGPYEIVAPLGAGGMGEVYRARDTRLGREVAVKVLPALFATDPSRLVRFEREARAVAALSHPNILAIHDYGTHETVPYAVMELLEGETVRDRLKKGPLPWRESVEIGAAIADGLAAAHAKGIIHRDLKPENLFLTSDGRVKILDFGLARVAPTASPQDETRAYVPAETDAGTVMGTVGYMSPEQVRGQPADARSDLFSFGCVLYEMVTGRRAFQRDTAAETMTAILHDEPADPTAAGAQLSAELGRLLRQCLAKSPNARLQSARDLALGLRATATNPVAPYPPVARRFPLRLVGILAAVLLIAAIGTSVYVLTRPTQPANPGKLSPQSEAIATLAVLPFENVGSDPATEHLSDGIPDALIHSLSRMRRADFKVRSLISVARYKGRRPEFAELRRELEVGAVVTGRLEQRSDTIAVSVSLIDVRDGTEVWGKHYENKLPDILAMQNAIAKDLAVHLRLRLTGDEERRLARRDTDNPEAYQLYLKARYFWNQRGRSGLEKAIEYFGRATDADPTYARAYAGLADVYAVFPDVTDTHPAAYYTKAKAAARKALDLDDQLAEAHATLALLHMVHDWKWSDAEKSFKRAIQLDANYATARQWYAQYLTALRRFDEAKNQYQKALELDPLSLIINAAAGRGCLYAGQCDSAIDHYRKALEMNPGFWVARLFLAQAYVEKGMYDDALAELQTVRRFSGEHTEPIALTGRAYALMSRPSDAYKVIDELKAMAKQRYVSPSRFAAIYASLGDNDQALDWLEKAHNERCGFLRHVKVEPAYQGLHASARFTNLLRQMGLADKAATNAQAVHSVAVLPFVNVSDDPKSEFLSDGVADQIINSLSQVRRRDLIVRPFTSVSRYKGKAVDVPAFGRELNVQMIVTGTLRQQGDDLTISVAVIDVREDNQLWGDTYPGKRGEILDLQDRIAREVAAKLRLQLSGEEDKRLTKRDTQDPEAYLLYREGVYHWNKFTPQGIQTAIEYFQRAIKKDPNYALAYAGLGRSDLLLGTTHLGLRKTYAQTKKHLTRAVEIDNSLLVAHTGLGLIAMFHDWNWPEAKRRLQHGLDPDSSAPADNMYGFYLAAMGKPGDALVFIRRAQEADPLAARRRHELAMCYNWMRQHDRAITEAEKALELDPNFPLAWYELGMAYVHMKKYEQAIARTLKELDRGHKHPRILGLLAYAYAAAGKKAEAQRVLQELTQHAQDRYGFALPIARVHAALGEKDQAVEWLRKACDERDPQVIWLKVDATLGSLRSDPQFAKVREDLGLPP